MAITLEDLCVALGEDIDRATLLTDWAWLTGGGMQPLMLSVAGDAFVQARQEQAVYFLDCVDGVLEKVADDLPEFLQRPGDAEFVAHCFRFDLVAPRLRSGEALAAGQVWAFRLPPVLGGARSSEALEPTDLKAYLSLTGQLHAQVASLPPGVTVDDLSHALE
ncbi:T6SS immunity protein Tdi1 domain-containing protein [Pseudoxanthomonas winnipegensis]|uniref:T6SS immunity protein Tdi1 domain-containing protein n=1 Tax=Pseudoxanthomonas winnipegensis TaxID=2480810 RepID=UPI001040B95E|nr:T6SS immunity protein Tdi1 domain-containing protein [Pseudoxanthomonas winnipegensis]TBV76676.1 DUF1851 domain-containing protein [Pseudoxanthomonas winnipegensis]